MLTKETLSIIVVTSTKSNPDNPEKEVDLRIEKEDGCVSVFLDNKLVCQGDWEDGFKSLFRRALEIWNT